MIHLAKAPVSAPLSPNAAAYEVVLGGGQSEVYGAGPPAFRVLAADRKAFERFWRAGTYTAAMAFVRGDIDVQGDLVAAVGMHLAAPANWRHLVRALGALLAPARLETFFQTRARAAANIRRHYDCSNEFYEQFLDPRMVYSCAYFEDASTPLAAAQLAKLDHICRKLDIHRGETFLDIGCGWGALVVHAAERYGAVSSGCTLSQRQFDYAEALAHSSPAAGHISILEVDYRDLHGRYDKIASVGMFEHVGRRRLGAYFRKVEALLASGGLFLNHGIIRPQTEEDSTEMMFLRRNVFPGGELAHLAGVVREAETAGFEVLDVENLRPHYALTCRAWVRRLQENAAGCLRAVDAERYRTWLLYLAASSHFFATGQIAVYQILMAKRSSPQGRRLTRDYMYRL